jgi:hypothetical protein
MCRLNLLRHGIVKAFAVHSPIALELRRKRDKMGCGCQTQSGMPAENAGRNNCRDLLYPPQMRAVIVAVVVGEKAGK